MDYFDHGLDGFTGGFAHQRIIEFIPVVEIEFFRAEGNALFRLLLADILRRNYFAGRSIDHADVHRNRRRGSFHTHAEAFFGETAADIAFGPAKLRHRTEHRQFDTEHLPHFGGTLLRDDTGLS